MFIKIKVNLDEDIFVLKEGLLRDNWAAHFIRGRRASKIILAKLSVQEGNVQSMQSPIYASKIFYFSFLAAQNTKNSFECRSDVVIRSLLSWLW